MNNATPDLDDLIKLVSNVTEAYTAILFLPSPGGEGLTVAACHTLSKHLDYDVTIAPGEGLVGWVAKHGQPLPVARFERDSRSLLYYTEAEDIKSFLAVPVDGGRGVLAVDSKKSYGFTDMARKILADLAAMTNHLLGAHRIRRRERRYAAMLDFLYDVENLSLAFRDPLPYFRGVLEAGINFTRTESGFLCLVSSGGKKYTVEAVEGPAGRHLVRQSFAMQKGLMGRLLGEGKALVLPRIVAEGQRSHIFSPDDPFGGFSSFVGVPVMAHRRLVGGMGFAAAGYGGWHDDEINGLWLCGHRVASTLEHFGVVGV